MVGGMKREIILSSSEDVLHLAFVFSFTLPPDSYSFNWKLFHSCILYSQHIFIMLLNSDRVKSHQLL
jgi:hypothetical protein